jgi:hypothetical protein
MKLEKNKTFINIQPSLVCRGTFQYRLVLEQAWSISNQFTINVNLIGHQEEERISLFTHLDGT